MCSVPLCADDLFFVIQKHSISWDLIFWLLVLVSVLLVYCSESFFYCAMSSRLFLILSSIRFKVSGKILRYLIHWSWFSCCLECINLFLFFYMWPFHLTNTTHWRCCLWTQCVFLFSLQKLNQMSIGMWIYICHSIWFIDQCVCFIIISCCFN